MTARELAEGLVAEIRQAHRTNVYLYEYISDEKKTQAMARAAARQRALAFGASIEQYRLQSQAQGREFLQADDKMHYQTFRLRDQVAVLVGGFRTEDEAVRALAEVKKWAPPRDKRLMDGGALSNSSADGRGGVIERTYFNPFATAMVVPNPTIPKPPQEPAPKVDPFLVRLNEGKPYNLLKARGTWTLGVKSFSAPVVLQTRDDNPGWMRKIGFGKGGDALVAGAEQAESLAKALRAMKGPNQEPLHLEAFVLHTRTGSIVTVGSFDSPNDPALAATHRLLANLNFQVRRDPANPQPVPNMESVFEKEILPIPIPKP
jgi:hypothetical protein